MNVWLTTNDENGDEWCSEEKSPPSRYQLEPLFSRENLRTQSVDGIENCLFFMSILVSISVVGM
jgi:hypothetical protein